MKKQNLNKKNVDMQDSMNNIQSLAQSIMVSVEEGNNPKDIVMSLIDQGISEYDLREALVMLGLDEKAIDAYMEKENPYESIFDSQMYESNQEENYEEEQPYNEADYNTTSEPEVETGLFGAYLPEMQYGGFFPGSINQYFSATEDGYRSDPRANYLPMDLGMKGDPLSGFLNTIGAVGDLVKDLKSSKTELKNGGDLPKAQMMGEFDFTKLLQNQTTSPQDFYGFPGSKQGYSGATDMTPLDNDDTTIDSESVKNNSFKDGLNKVMNSKAMKLYSGISDIAVQGAGWINEMFANRRGQEARRNLMGMTQADRLYGYYEDPVNKRGMWDINTGLAEPDNYVPYMQEGGETEMELTQEEIAKLIAAGADIEIL